MSVHILLERPYAYFTNLDIIRGKVILHTVGNETISGIVVKLEGESNTKLAAPPQQQGRRDRDRSITEMEVHKLLYKIITVFPPPELQQASPSNTTYTLPAGQYEYPFEFKIPFNNFCSSRGSMLPIGPTGLRMEMARNTDQHVKKPLPPSLSGFPNEAEIKYYVKVTVQRSAFYKENFRAIAHFKFFPIEPLRPPPNQRECYARRQHQFSPHGPQIVGFLRKQSLPTASDGTTTPPKISIESRLPDPGIITCNEPLPLRVLVKKLNETSEIIYLQLLQVELIGYTTIRAHELTRQEGSSWIIITQANLHIPLGNSNTLISKEMEIDKSMWSNISLPNTVPPSFDTCNLSRRYELEIRVGLAHGVPGDMKPDLTVQPLRMPVFVYSGIPPSLALITEMNKHLGRPRPQKIPGPSPNPPQLSPLSSPSSANASFAGPLLTPAQVSVGEIPEEAPPSYEDAMADDLGPVDGPRRDYQQPEVTGSIGDSKTGGLFSNNQQAFT